MSSCVYWTIVDNTGTNPTNKPGVFEAKIWYTIDYSVFDNDYAVNYLDSVTLLAADCTEVLFYAEQQRRSPTEDEAPEISAWCMLYIDTHFDEQQKIKAQALEYSYITPDY